MYYWDWEAFKNDWLQSSHFILTFQLPLKDSVHSVGYLQWLTIIRDDKAPGCLVQFSNISSNYFINFYILLIRFLKDSPHTHNLSQVLRSITRKLTAGSLKTWGNQFFEKMIPLLACKGIAWIYVLWLVPNLSSIHSVHLKSPRLIF